jgi:glucan biosynthesis protein C
METKVSSRNNYLDWLRVLGILTVFVYHSTRFFNMEDWQVKNATWYNWVEVWNRFATTWMLPLIFVISGASLFYAVGKSGAGKFITDKVLRLLVPLVVCDFTHASLQVYLQQFSHGQFSGTYFQFLPRYFFGDFEWKGMHLWYLLALFLFTLILYPLMRWLKGGGKRVLAKLGDWFALPGAIYLLVLPSFLVSLVLDPTKPWMELYAGWPLVIYLWLVLVGFVIVSNDRLQASFQQLRWLSLPVGLVLTGLSIYLIGIGEIAIGTLRFTVGSGLRALGSWCCILAILGFGIQYLTVRKPFLTYANEAVLPFYILHQTVLLSVGFFVVKWLVPDLLKWVVILLVSFGIIMVLYEYLVRRFNVMRFLFGMKLITPRPARQATEPKIEEASRIG